MTVESEVKRSDYAGDGTTVDFATGFRFLEDGDLKVIKTVVATGIETELDIISDYTVTGAGDDMGGTVTTLVAPLSTEKLSILRNVPLTQGTDYVENDEFPAESHERALDKLTMIVQQIQEQLDRTLKQTESQEGAGLTVPPSQEGKFLQWDDDGDLQNVDIKEQGGLAVGTFGELLIANETAAAARSDLELQSGATTTVGTSSVEDVGTSVGDVVQLVDVGGSAGLPVVEGGQLTGVANSALSNLSAQGQKQIVYAWVNFDGTGVVTIRDSYNVSSIIDHAPGEYTVVFANPLPNANYSVGGTSSSAVTGSASVSLGVYSPGKTANSVRVFTSVASAAPSDREEQSVQIFGSL